MEDLRRTCKPQQLDLAPRRPLRAHSRRRSRCQSPWLKCCIDRAAALTPDCCLPAERRWARQVARVPASDSCRLLQRRADTAACQSRRECWSSSSAAANPYRARFLGAIPFSAALASIMKAAERFRSDIERFPNHQHRRVPHKLLRAVRHIESERANGRRIGGNSTSRILLSIALDTQARRPGDASADPPGLDVCLCTRTIGPTSTGALQSAIPEHACSCRPRLAASRLDQRECEGGSGAPVHDEHVTPGVRRDGARHAAEENTCETALAVGAEHDQARVAVVGDAGDPFPGGRFFDRRDSVRGSRRLAPSTLPVRRFPRQLF